MDQGKGYQSPQVEELGTIEEMTRGQINIAISDFPIGSGDVLSGPLPIPSLPPLP